MTRRMSHCLLALSGLAVLGACTTSPSVGSATTSTVTDATTTAPADTTSTTDSLAAATTTTTETTEAPAPALTLRVDGIGAFDLGSPAPDVLGALTAHLGSPDTDEPRFYPAPDGSGGYTTPDGEFGFVQSVGRSVCWLLGFCAEFGGGVAASDAQLQLTGWSYGGDTSGELSTADGITIGTLWSDAPTMTVRPGGCYSQGYGETGDGIRLTLQSNGIPFSEFDSGGNYLEHLPDSADVEVFSMDAGDIPAFLFADC